MATTELTTLRRAVDDLREAVDSVRNRYGDIPAVRRLLNDIERIDLDTADLDDITPLAGATEPASGEMHILDDTPPDPSLWRDADDEGLGGYHR